MKHSALLGLLGLTLLVAPGCPVFPSGGGVCSTCGTDFGTGACQRPSDCADNETCGDDARCHSGDCSYWGCVAPYACEVDPGTRLAACVNASGQGGGSGGTTTVAPVYCGGVRDCSAGSNCAPDGTCKPGSCGVTGCAVGTVCAVSGACERERSDACAIDGDCTGAGVRCVSGRCTAPGDQCFDQTQCPAEHKCVDGRCITACLGDGDCPDAYRCTTALGVCSTAAAPCARTTDCASAALVCVAGACVPRATGGVCVGADVLVDGGCVPSASASFFCSGDGVQDRCANGSVCLHHSCYISCEAANAGACTSQPTFNVCKDVVTSSGGHRVCGSAENLGSECSPEKACTLGRFCVDGYCR